jgi:hypothetical protein
VRTAGDAVIYKITLGNKVLENLTVHPSGDDWFKFIQGLNDAKVYKWADLLLSGAGSLVGDRSHDGRPDV